MKLCIFSGNYFAFPRYGSEFSQCCCTLVPAENSPLYRSKQGSVIIVSHKAHGRASWDPWWVLGWLFLCAAPSGTESWADFNFCISVEIPLAMSSSWWADGVSQGISTWWGISPCPYLHPESSILVFPPCPAEQGRDGAALVGTWHPTRVSPPQEW